MRVKYLEELRRASRFLAEKPDILFIGQNTIYPGSIQSGTFINEIPLEKRIELPVIENTQLGISIGLALKGGFVPMPKLFFM